MIDESIHYEIESLGFIGFGIVVIILQVCLQAAQPGNKNRRLNTSVLIRHPNSLGTQNILIDAGKYVLNCPINMHCNCVGIDIR